MSELDDILFDPQNYFIQEPDTDHFVRYDINASNQLMKPEIKDLLLKIVEKSKEKDLPISYIEKEIQKL